MKWHGKDYHLSADTKQFARTVFAIQIAIHVALYSLVPRLHVEKRGGTWYEASTIWYLPPGTVIQNQTICYSSSGSQRWSSSLWSPGGVLLLFSLVDWEKPEIILVGL